MPTHTSTITGVVQDIFCSLDQVASTANRPPFAQHISPAAGQQADSYDDLISDMLFKSAPSKRRGGAQAQVAGGRALGLKNRLTELVLHGRRAPKAVEISAVGLVEHGNRARVVRWGIDRQNP